MDSGTVEALLIEAAGLECTAANEKLRPSYLYRPKLSVEGDRWCALYGDNLQDGVSAFGDSPDAAYRAFDAVWYQKLGPRKP